VQLVSGVLRSNTDMQHKSKSLATPSEAPPSGRHQHIAQCRAAMRTTRRGGMMRGGGFWTKTRHPLIIDNLCIVTSHSSLARPHPHHTVPCHGGRAGGTRSVGTAGYRGSWSGSETIEGRVGVRGGCGDGSVLAKHAPTTNHSSDSTHTPTHHTLLAVEKGCPATPYRPGPTSTRDWSHTLVPLAGARGGSGGVVGVDTGRREGWSERL
jgi:hypothetical protein